MLRYFLTTFLAALAFVAFMLGGTWLVYGHNVRPLLDQQAPELTGLPESIALGVNGVSLSLSISDASPGIDEIVVRVQQRRGEKEIARRKLGGVVHADLEIPLVPPRGQLDEGEGILEVLAFDKSMWSNKTEIQIPLFVDMKEPRVDVVTTQHNARQGGTQLVVYRASDNNLIDSGVWVGAMRYRGVPFSSVDPSVTAKDAYIALYSVPLQSFTPANELRVYAEDRAGNIGLAGFYNKVQPRSFRPVKGTAGLAPVEELEETEAAAGETAGQLIVQRPDKSAVSAQANPLLQRPLTRPDGTITQSFGDVIVTQNQNGDVKREPVLGYRFLGLTEMKAAQNGTVISVTPEGGGKSTVTVDHGLGLSSVYELLTHVNVKSGQAVTQGQVLGQVGGRAAFSLTLYGVKVDPLEWWSKEWFQSHILSKLKEARRVISLGL